MVKKTDRFYATSCLIVLAVFLAIPGHILAEQSGKRKSTEEPVLSSIDRTLPRTNNVLFGIDNSGNIGKDPAASSTRSGGYWRVLTDNYIFQAGLQAAGVIDAKGGTLYGDTVEANATFDEEWREGKASSNWDDPANCLNSSLYARDLEEWPEEFRDENGDPKLYGQEDIVCIYTDVNGYTNTS